MPKALIRALTIFKFLHLLGMKIPSNIIRRSDLILSLIRFLDPVPGSHLQWKLCYRASSHGWAARTFHSRCDGKPHTVTIIRKSQYVFGGYTDIAWGKNIIIRLAHNLTINLDIISHLDRFDFIKGNL